MNLGLSLKVGAFLGFKTFLLSWKNGWSRLLLSSSLAMALGLVPLVVVLSIADGMIEGITARTIETATYHIQIWPSFGSGDAQMELKPHLNELVSSVIPGAQVWPERSGFALAYASGQKLGVNLRGVDPQWFKDDPKIKHYLKAQEGKLEFSDSQVVFVGREVAKKLNLTVGSTLKVMTVKSLASHLVAPRITTLRVGAIISVGYKELDRLWVFLPYETAEMILPPQQNPTFWGVKVPNPNQDIEQQSNKLNKVLGTDYTIAPWTEIARSQNMNLQATRTLLGLIMVLILLVATVNVSTAMVTLVLERNREIAIIKSIGGSPLTVGIQFSVLGICSGVIAAIVGIGIGVLFSLEVNNLISCLDFLVNLFYHPAGGNFKLLSENYYLENIPVHLDAGLLCLLGVGTVGLSLLASWMPARKAAKMRPLEVFRKI